jgi:putative hemolysin
MSTRTLPQSAAPAKAPDFEVRLARDEADLRAAQQLRYRVFVREMGGGGAQVDHAAGLERDGFDAHCDHLLLTDRARPGAPVVGVYRLLTDARAARAGGFYTETEYDIAPLRRSGRRLMELGRSCLDPAYRGGTGAHLLWCGLGDYVRRHGVELLFGTASFPGTDPARLAPALALLHHRHLAPPELRVRARAERFQPMDLLPEDGIDRLAAMRATPALIKGYLRLGGVVGEGAWIDRAFNTTDVCLVLDTARLDPMRRGLYGGAAG